MSLGKTLILAGLQNLHNPYLDCHPPHCKPLQEVKLYVTSGRSATGQITPELGLNNSADLSLVSPLVTPPAIKIPKIKYNPVNLTSNILNNNDKG